ncbi:uncharacterized protein LOC144164923 [Haemaphysalis longicornis]
MQRLRQNSTSSSDDDSVVPRALLLDEQQKSAAFRRKLATVRQEYHELQVRHNSLQDRHSKLEYVLLHKLGVSADFREAQAVVPGESERGDNGSCTAGCSSGCHGSLGLVSDSTDLPQLPENRGDGAHLPPNPPCSATPPPAPTTETTLQGLASLSALHDGEDDMDPASTCAASTSQTPGILARVGDQVHLGNDVFVSAQRWEWLLSRKKDSLFVKELTKAVWGVANLRGRSVMGAPCRRFLNSKEPGTVPKKRALTPRKLHAVASAFDHFIGRADIDVPAKTRRLKMNRFLAEMLKDLK